MQVPVMTKSLAGSDQRCSTDAHSASLFHQPMRQRLVVMQVVLLGEKGQLETVHRIRRMWTCFNRSFPFTCRTELDRRLGVEELDLFGPQLREEPIGLLCRHRHDDFQGLVGEFDEMC